MPTFTSLADIQQALADPNLVPLPAEAGGAPGTMAWFRSTVARFAHGPDHARRRAYVESELARLDADEIRRLAADSLEKDDRRRVVEALAAALGLDIDLGLGLDVDITDVLTVANNYFDPVDPAADQAVARLLPQMREPDPERAANRLGILVQACDATAALIANARVGDDTPPVQVMRRTAIAPTVVGTTPVEAGDLVLLEVGPVGLTFGAGPRVCPGRHLAEAIARGALETS